MPNSKRILITGAGSGLGEGTAIGLAQLGHEVFAGVHIGPQVTVLRDKARELGITENLRVERLDILDKYDVSAALRWDADILVNNAGIGETGPVSETPLELVRRNFETNVFAPLDLTQRFVANLIEKNRKGKVVWLSSMGGLFTPTHFGIYCSTKHALEAIAESMKEELEPFGIKVQTINPGAFFTGFNERMSETSFRWLNDAKNFTKKAALKASFDKQINTPDWKLDPQDMIDEMVRVVPAETGKFRNVFPQFVEDMLKDGQAKAWENTI
ncbi:SDR family oxidoreductase [Dyadobacter sp. CY351]|uniref:SDR family oxidoreductase n=1 Tax=Dyadobacter sp. CY351 TaxID=2909337 RepID=UPI001F3CDABE|nr:SDR family oxidoreductase [Dyadobacter sp. CY351]MCF2518801.1 SDR family oxidoreductase [Dyadobacter sp. CY351]